VKYSNKKTRFRIITILFCLICLLSLITNSKISFILYVITVGIVILEAIILTIKAIGKKIKGARIIGAGILSFTFFILFLLILLLLDSLRVYIIPQGSTSNYIISFIAACAILIIPISMSLYLSSRFSSLNKDLKNQLHQVKLLSDQTLEQEQEKKRILENQKEELERKVEERTEELVQKNKIVEREKQRSDDLLLNILPAEVAEELKEKGSAEAKYFDHVTVLFTDFVGFTKAGERMSPQQLVDELDACFKEFDGVTSKYGIEKIKKIGDAYLAVSGLPIANPDHAANIVDAAMEICAFMMQRKQQMGDKTFEVRIDVHSGSVVAGIVGIKKFAYDIWGDTVNTAARMEQNSEPGKINISQTTYELVKDKITCEYRGEIDAKNKGAMRMYFVQHMDHHGEPLI